MGVNDMGCQWVSMILYVNVMYIRTREFMGCQWVSMILYVNVMYIRTREFLRVMCVYIYTCMYIHTYIRAQPNTQAKIDALNQEASQVMYDLGLGEAPEHVSRYLHHIVTCVAVCVAVCVVASARRLSTSHST